MTSRSSKVQTVLDVLYLTDLRFPGGSSSSLIEEAKAAISAGYRVGVLHCKSSSLKRDRTFHPGVRTLLEEGSMVLVRPDEPIDCAVAIVKHPTILTTGFGGRLPIRSGQNVVFVGQVPSDSDGTVYYTPSEVHQHVIDALGDPPVWHPVSPVVRSHLEDAGVPLADLDWVEVIDPEKWVVDRPGPSGGRPIIGRHGRPARNKWPDNAEDLTAAYPVDGRAVVRVLGGVDGLQDILGEGVPTSWEVHSFGHLEPEDFLRGVDFFVYFHHRDLVEAFGRTTLEALASGCVVILPPHFESLFGSACIYAEPQEVWPVVESLYGNPEKFRSISKQGLQQVRDRFSYETHIERIAALIGSPCRATGRAAPTGQLPRGLREQRTHVLVTCVGMNDVGVAETIRDLEAHRDRATGFTPIVLTTVPAPAIASYLDEDLILNAQYRLFVGSRSGILIESMESREDYGGPDSFEDYLMEKITRLRRTHQIGSVTVADLGHPDSWLVLQSASG
ncbi:MAG: glycosyltransferase [Acidimicrobiales bacterium]|nr:glycosyltransferase [Acidimicrobiales bacterium]